MNYFNYKWKEYIERYWSFYVNYPAFFSFNNSNEIQIFDGNYGDKLIEEFNKYYDSKKKYVSMYSEFKEKFGDYEKIEIKSYDQELEDYKNRVILYSEELYNTIKKLLSEKSFNELQTVDFKLLLLGYVDSGNYNNIYKYYQRIFNKANIFLSGYFDYYDYIKEYVDEEILDISFHDAHILEVIRKDKNLTLVIEDSYWPHYKLCHLTFINLNNDLIDEEGLFFDIITNSLYYKNNKYYYYIETDRVSAYEFICDDIKLDIVKSK